MRKNSTKTAPRMRDFLVHQCDLLAKTNEDMSPYASWCDRLLIKLQYQRTVYRTANSEQYFRSSTAFRREIDRHLKTPNCKLTIHPFSKLASIERYIISCVWVVVFIIGPLHGSFFYRVYVYDYPNFQLTHFILKVTHVFIIIDVIFRLFLGYIQTSTNEVILARQKIIKNYLKTYFFIDIFSPIIANLIYFFPVGSMFRVLFYGCNLIFLTRSITFFQYIDWFMRQRSIQDNTRNFIHFTILSILVLHWWTCIFRGSTAVWTINANDTVPEECIYYEFLVAKSTVTLSNVVSEHDDDKIEAYVFFYSVVLCHFCGAGYSADINHSFEQNILSLVLASGLIFYTYIIAKILEFFSNLNISERKYEEVLWQMKNYMVTQRYPKRLKKRILKYYDVKYDKKYFAEDAILKGLTEHLRMEVVLYGSRHLIDRLHHFKNVSFAVLGTFLSLYKLEIYLPKDEITRTDDEQYKYFIILYGTCAVKLLSGAELTHIEDGGSFGNAWNYIKGSRTTDFVYKIVALEPCEIFVLDAKDVRYTITNHPIIGDKIGNAETQRDKLYQSLYERFAEERGVDASDIAAELRRGKIIDHGTKRSER